MNIHIGEPEDNKPKDMYDIENWSMYEFARKRAEEKDAWNKRAKKLQKEQRNQITAEQSKYVPIAMILLMGITVLLNSCGR